MKNKECGHPKYKKQNHERDFQGEKFPYEAKTCQDCGSVLWDKPTEVKYNSWLEKLQVQKRHLFQIQYNLSEKAQLCIDKLMERFPSVDESLLIRAIVMVYINVVEEDENMRDLLLDVESNKDYKLLSSGEKRLKKIQFKPNGIKDILTLSEMIKARPSKIVEDSLYRMLFMSIRNDPEMKKFWEEVVLKNIETILKAA